MASLNNLFPWPTGENSETIPADAEASIAEYGGDALGTSTDGDHWQATTPSNAIAQAIAGREAIETEDLPPLYESVDTDGLNAVLQSAPNASITFPYRGYEVTVTGSGDIDLIHLDDE